MNLLAVDTSTDLCSVALMVGSDILERKKLSAKQHTTLLLPLIEEVLREAGLNLVQLQAIAFGSGPGSFTGLRIAASVVQGIAFSHDLPVIPISTLSALAWQGVRVYDSRGIIIPALDARMGQIYWAVYRWNNQRRLDTIIPDSLGDFTSLISKKEWLSGNLGIGPGWKTFVFPEERQLMDSMNTVSPDRYPEAVDVAVLAAQEFLQGHTIAPEQALPFYLRETIVNL